MGGAFTFSIQPTARGMAVLERNPATDKKLEFLRLRLMRRDAKGAMANSMRSRSGSTVRLSDLPRNVAKERESGIVHIENIPMVDQGPKGYCVVASAQRLLEYYGIPCDQHQLAAICGTETSGTDSGAMMEALRKIDHRFKLRFRPLALSTNRGLRAVVRDKEFGKAVDGDDFFEIVVDSIDDGIPMLWVLELGRYPEKPAIAPQTRGAHMRLITGYNKETGRIYFSDSWGAGHERKSMAVGHAYQATFGVFHLNPTTR